MDRDSSLAGLVQRLIEAADDCVACYYGDDIDAAYTKLEPLADDAARVADDAGYDGARVRYMALLARNDRDRYRTERDGVYAMLLEAVARLDRATEPNVEPVDDPHEPHGYSDEKQANRDRFIWKRVNERATNSEIIEEIEEKILGGCDWVRIGHPEGIRKALRRYADATGQPVPLRKGGRPRKITPN